MSSYTMQLREYIEQTSQNDDSLKLKDRIEIGRTKLFDFDYPIFDEDYRKVFETHFIRRFYMREIGFETEGLFKFNLETWLIINMPYFNKMFESELIEYDPLTNSKMEISHNKTNDTSQNSSSSGTSNGSAESNSTGSKIDDKFNRHLNSNNPDSRLSITSNDGEGVIEYASEIDEDTENNKTDTNTTSSGSSETTSTNTVTNDINETEDFIQSRIGKIGVQSYAKMVQEYRQALLRIENTIFDEMNELFMLVY